MPDVKHFSRLGLAGSFIKSIQAQEPDEFQEQIKVFAPGVMVSKVAPGKFSAKGKAVRTPETALFHLNVLNIRVQWEPFSDYVSTTIPIDGRAAFVEGGTVHHLGRDRAHVLRPETPFDFRLLEAHSVMVLNMSQQLVRQTMCDLGNGDEIDVSRLPIILDLRSEEGASLLRIASVFWREFLQSPALWKSPKMTKHVENILTNSFVLAAQTANGAKSGQDNWLPPKFIAAALDFMHANLDSPLTLAEICTAVGAEVRTLTRAFHRKHGMGPVGYHRQLRLERAHLDLITADAVETTVTDVAMNTGFYQLSHFAAAYKTLFGEAPSDTLKN